MSNKADSIAPLGAFPPGFSGSGELTPSAGRAIWRTAMLLVKEYEQETPFGQHFVVRYQALKPMILHLAGRESFRLP
jgi:hypothetical protein